MSSAEKIQLAPISALFGNQEQEKVQILEVEPEQLFAFKNHPFFVKDDEEMSRLVQSAKENGILEPILVRKLPEGLEGQYEILSGHRRKHAAVLAKCKVPVLVGQYNDDQATIIMVDSNLQREKISIREKAFAYRMKYEAMKHQGKKINGQVLPSEKSTADVVGEAGGDSGRTVQRFIRITYLSEDFLNLLDEEVLSFSVGVVFSYFRMDEQNVIYKFYKNTGKLPNERQGKMIKAALEDGMSVEDALTKIFSLENTLNKKPKITLSSQHLYQYFPPQMGQEQMEEVIEMLLKDWAVQNGYQSHS